MAKGHVEIYDPLDKNTSQTPKTSSESEAMADSVEFKLLMAYAKRRWPDSTVASPQCSDDTDTPRGLSSTEGPSSPDTPANGKDSQNRKKDKKKRRRVKLPKILSCLKPQIKDEEQPEPEEDKPVDIVFRNGPSDEDGTGEENKLDEAASKLTELAMEIPFTSPQVEKDNDTDEVERVIALLLREAGDKLNEEMLSRMDVPTELFGNYSFFERLMRTFLIRVGLLNPQPDALGPQASPKTQIAVTCEVTTRLSNIHTLPMARMYGNGARFLQENYSSWIQSHGGYEEAFYSDDEDD